MSLSECWRDALGEVGFLSIVASNLSSDTDKDLAMQMLRFIGNCCYYHGANRERLAPHFQRVVQCLDREELRGLSLSVINNFLDANSEAKSEYEDEDEDEGKDETENDAEKAESEYHADSIALPTAFSCGLQDALAKLILSQKLAPTSDDYSCATGVLHDMCGFFDGTGEFPLDEDDIEKSEKLLSTQSDFFLESLLSLIPTLEWWWTAEALLKSPVVRARIAHSPSLVNAVLQFFENYTRIRNAEAVAAKPSFDLDDFKDGFIEAMADIAGQIPTPDPAVLSTNHVVSVTLLWLQPQLSSLQHTCASLMLGNIATSNAVTSALVVDLKAHIPAIKLLDHYRALGRIEESTDTIHAILGLLCNLALPVGNKHSLFGSQLLLAANLPNFPLPLLTATIKLIRRLVHSFENPTLVAGLLNQDPLLWNKDNLTLTHLLQHTREHASNPQLKKDLGLLAAQFIRAAFDASSPNRTILANIIYHNDMMMEALLRDAADMPPTRVGNPSLMALALATRERTGAHAVLRNCRRLWGSRNKSGIMLWNDVDDAEDGSPWFEDEEEEEEDEDEEDEEDRDERPPREKKVCSLSDLLGWSPGLKEPWSADRQHRLIIAAQIAALPKKGLKNRDREWLENYVRDEEKARESHEADMKRRKRQKAESESGTEDDDEEDEEEEDYEAFAKDEDEDLGMDWQKRLMS
ncbi:hypothetical protein EJ06DRAFT_534361 [Trichodelitschia bisporula]|uniref:ARM repeat-containing protein n=1 Tax=Trichodelitschia bisporula TaxID=703511 RepID=A0A6G1HKC8_9PEZI|nr:hypothetical protein EJ06DRAFT_534361 [Trichodelitschia bisporula]